MVAISRRGELGAANGAGGAAVLLLCLLRASVEAKEKAENEMRAWGVSGRVRGM